MLITTSTELAFINGIGLGLLILGNIFVYLFITNTNKDHNTLLGGLFLFSLLVGLFMAGGVWTGAIFLSWGYLLITIGKTLDIRILGHISFWVGATYAVLAATNTHIITVK